MKIFILALLCLSLVTALPARRNGFDVGAKVKEAIGKVKAYAKKRIVAFKNCAVKVLKGEALKKLGPMASMVMGGMGRRRLWPNFKKMAGKALNAAKNAGCSAFAGKAKGLCEKGCNALFAKAKGAIASKFPAVKPYIGKLDGCIQAEFKAGCSAIVDGFCGKKVAAVKDEAPSAAVTAAESGSTAPAKADTKTAPKAGKKAPKAGKKDTKKPKADKKAKGGAKKSAAKPKAGKKSAKKPSAGKKSAKKPSAGKKTAKKTTKKTAKKTTKKAPAKKGKKPAKKAPAKKGKKPSKKAPAKKAKKPTKKAAKKPAAKKGKKF